MIFLGVTQADKPSIIADYCLKNAIEKVFILSPENYHFEHNLENAEVIRYQDIIEYRYFYRLLQEINSTSLVVVNECLRTQNRYDLTYNCIRHFLNQAKHQIVFQWLPFIEDIQDFMILFDFDTRSRWKREKFDIDLLQEVNLTVARHDLQFDPVRVETGEKLQAAYLLEKEKLIAGIGIKDPHTIPRNLYLMSGKARMQAVEDGVWYIGRNNRFKFDTMQTYKEKDYAQAPYTVFEFPHNFIDFCDFAALSQQQAFKVLVSDLKVDQWYLQRYQQWSERLHEAYTNLS